MNELQTVKSFIEPAFPLHEPKTIKVLVITSCILCSDLLTASFNKFERLFEVNNCHFEKGFEGDVKTLNPTTIFDLIILFEPETSWYENSIFESLTDIRINTPILLICSNNNIPEQVQIRRFNIRDIVFMDKYTLKDLETSIYNILDNKSKPSSETWYRFKLRKYTTMPSETLNSYEKKIVTLLSIDLKDREIAELLGVSVRSITYQLPLIYAKLGVTSRAGAVGVALSNGVITPTDHKFIKQKHYNS